MTQNSSTPSNKSTEATETSETTDQEKFLKDDLDTIKQLFDIYVKSGISTQSYTTNSIKYQMSLIWKHKASQVFSKSSLLKLAFAFYKQNQEDKNVKSFLQYFIHVDFSFPDNKYSCKFSLKIHLDYDCQTGKLEYLGINDEPTIVNSFDSKFLNNDQFIEFLKIFDKKTGWEGNLGESIVLMGLCRESREQVLSKCFGIDGVGLYFSKFLKRMDHYSHFQKYRVNFLFMMFNNLDFSNYLFNEISMFCAHQKRSEKVETRVMTDGCDFNYEELNPPKVITKIDPNTRYFSVYPHRYRELEKVLMTLSLNEMTTLKFLVQNIESKYHRKFTKKVIKSSIQDLQKVVSF